MEAPPTALIAVVLLVSAVVTAFIWRQIALSNDPVLMKFALAAIVGIPVFGPLVWPFLDMPERLYERDRKNPYLLRPVVARHGIPDPPPSKPRWVYLAHWSLFWGVQVVLLVLYFAGVIALMVS